jgi:hypothetical protein
MYANGAFMNTKQVAARFGVSFSTASHWASKNAVGRTFVGGIFAFDWTEDDCRRFSERPDGRAKKHAPAPETRS